MNQSIITYKDVEAHAVNYYQTHGVKTDFLSTVQSLYQQKELLKNECQKDLDNFKQTELEYQEQKALWHNPEPPRLPARSEWKNMSVEVFGKVLEQLPISNPYDTKRNYRGTIQAESIMPEALEVYAIKYVRDIVTATHTHNFFEVNYVLSGSCLMTFENELRTLQEGELCIIAPHSKHDVTLNDESLVVSIMIRESTFETTFFKLLAQEDLLADFLRSILYTEKNTANYLLFQTDNSQEIIEAIRDIFMECHVVDQYANTCVISRVHLFFSQLLRNYGHSIQFYENRKNVGERANFTQILQYIQNHYQTVTLEQLADIFHYNTSYLCRSIKKNTGQSLVEILTKLKISKAADLLLHTSEKVESIAHHVGYDSVDHFSRQFKKRQGMSPSKFRSI